MRLMDVRVNDNQQNCLTAYDTKFPLRVINYYGVIVNKNK